MLVRREEQCNSINHKHHNTPYLHEFVLPHNVSATLSPAEALESTVQRLRYFHFQKANFGCGAALLFRC
jgi:glycerol-3-phosphate dehydrogenase